MEGWQGWDDYAAFYDWENARTVGRRDVAFWRALARRTDGSALELGCGTGRVLLPLARDGVAITGIDRSAPMLARARRRLVRLGRPAGVCLVRGDIRHLPFRRPAPFDLVIAPYGILQSLVREADLVATLASVARVTARGGLLGVDLVPDLSRWAEYHRHVSLRGTGLRRGTHLTLVESVHQDRRRRLTVFDQEYVERRGRRRRVHRFSLVFRSLTVPQMARRIERAGFRIEAELGDYDGGPWDPRADVWLILARRR